MNKEDFTYIDINLDYSGSINFFKRDNEIYLFWDKSYHLNFLNYILFSSENKNDLLYLTSNMKTETVIDNYLNNSYKINLGDKNTKYFRIAVVFKHNIINYSNIIEVSVG